MRRERIPEEYHEDEPSLGNRCTDLLVAAKRAAQKRRHPQTQLEQHFIGDALLAPRGVLLGHPADECLQLHRNPSPSRTRLPAPEQLESLTMPATAGWENAGVERRSSAATAKDPVASARIDGLLSVRHRG